MPATNAGVAVGGGSCVELITVESPRAEPIWASVVVIATPGPAGADAPFAGVDLVRDRNVDGDACGFVDAACGVNAAATCGCEDESGEDDGPVPDEFELDGSPQATPGEVITAAPKPKATAKPHTRPAYAGAFTTPPNAANTGN
jgi:hypothetical protein